MMRMQYKFGDRAYRSRQSAGYLLADARLFPELDTSRRILGLAQTRPTARYPTIIQAYTRHPEYSSDITRIFQDCIARCDTPYFGNGPSHHAAPAAHQRCSASSCGMFPFSCPLLSPKHNICTPCSILGLDLVATSGCDCAIPLQLPNAATHSAIRAWI